MDEQSKKRIDELAREILQMRTINKMCEEAPRDLHGNVVVSLVGISYVGVFYLFTN